MICDNCLERPATIHLTKIINGVKQESHLCEVCAQEAQQTMGSEQPSSFFDLISAMLCSESLGKSAATTQPNGGDCPNCGSRHQQFSQSGLVGCSECYTHFAEPLDAILRRIHGASRHVGKVPERRGGSLKLVKELETLRLQLQQVVANEEFEKAAVLRDQIKELENSVKEEGR